jgi:YfiH family protein
MPHTPDPIRLPPPFQSAGEHLAIDLPGARALFTTRRGGVSTGVYGRLNLGRWTDDDPAAVEGNRNGLERELRVRLAYGRQVHGAAVRRVTDAPKDRHAPEADGQATNLPGIAPMVLTADCLPIAIAAEGAVAMVHAGWRGLAGGVLAEGVDAVRELGGTGPLVAAIGPGAGPCCYEVGEEVHQAFGALGAATRRGRNLDLKEIAGRQLGRAGVAEVHDARLCTICSEPGLFFSHRRDHGLTGRQAGIAWLI